MTTSRDERELAELQRDYGAYCDECRKNGEEPINLQNWQVNRKLEREKNGA